MFTLLTFAGFIVVSCLAAAGLIASTQNNADEARAMAGFDLGGETRV